MPPKKPKANKKLLPRISKKTIPEDFDLSDSDEERKYITATEDQSLSQISLLIVHYVMGGYD